MYRQTEITLEIKTLGGRINLLLDEKSLTVYRIATDLNLNKMTLSNYVNDKVVRPNDHIIEALSKFFDVRPEWLKTGKGERGHYKALDVENKVAEAIAVRNYATMNVMTAPVVSAYAQAGYLSGFDDPEYIENLPHIPFSAEVEHKGEYIWFEVRGDSMNDNTSEAILEKDMLLCRNIRKDYWRNKLHLHKWKNFVIVHKTDGVLVKQITNHNVETGKITIHSLNDYYEDRELDLRDVAQIFNVVEIRRR